MTLLYLHGLESGPDGRKARWLRERYGAVTPAIDHAAPIRAVRALAAAGWRDGDPSLAEALAGPLAEARRAVEAHRPSVLVGSSFGGALAVALLREGVHVGPTLLLAPAAHRMLGPVALPEGRAGVVVHGRHDDVVPVEHGRALAASGGPGWLFVEVDDGHRLDAALDSGGVLDLALDWLAGRERTRG